MKERITREREGPVQLAIMAWLTRWNNGTVIEMARLVFKTKTPTVNHTKSVQRALKRLVEDGKIIESPLRAKNGQKQYSLVGGVQKRLPRIKKPLAVVK